VPAWGPPKQPNLKKYFRGINLLDTTDNYKHNGKSYTISELQLYAPTMEITVLYSHSIYRHIKTYMASRNLKLIRSCILSVEIMATQTKQQQNDYQSMYSIWAHTRALLGVCDYGPYFAPWLVNRRNENNPYNLHPYFSTDTQIWSHKENMGECHGDVVTYWWKRSSFL